MSRPIDKLRDGAGSIDISDADDPSPLQGMIGTSRRLLVVKDDSVHQIMFADDLDPDRTDISVPNVHQKLLTVGVTNHIVCRVLLQADVLFGRDLCPLPDAKSILEEAIQLTEILVKMKDISNNLSKQVNDAIAPLDTVKNRRSTTVPSIRFLIYELKEYIRHMNAIRQPIFDLIFDHFRVSKTGADIWTKIDTELSKATNEKNGRFRKFMREIKAPLEFARLLRNAIEHPKPNNMVTITDFRLLPGNKLARPSIAMVHPFSAFPAIDLIEFMSNTDAHFLEICELFFVNTADYFIHDKLNIQLAIGQVQPERRRYPETRFGYVVLLGNEWHPLS